VRLEKYNAEKAAKKKSPADFADKRRKQKQKNYVEPHGSAA
jgi:hypothetical protein